MRYVVIGGLATEEVGEELLLCDASGTAVHRISGDARRYFERVARGDGELPDDQVTAALIAANVLLPLEIDATSSGAEGMSRRQVMALGAAAAAAAGVVTIGLPSAAAAQSPGPDPGPYPPAPSGGNEGGTGGDYTPAAPATNTNTFALFDGWEQATETGEARVRWQVVTAVSPLTLAPVTFTYRFEAPPGTQIGSVGTAVGTTPDIFVPGVEQGSPYIWYLTASGGVQKVLTGNFS